MRRTARWNGTYDNEKLKIRNEKWGGCNKSAELKKTPAGGLFSGGRGTRTPKPYGGGFQDR